MSFAPSDSLRTASAKLARAFQEAGLATPDLDARFLMLGVLGLEPAQMLRAPGQALGDGASALAVAAQRRLAHEPVSRILGEREFYGRVFAITPDVLDPRPDTETVIDEVLAIVDRKGWRAQPLRIADIGLGSGAIVLTLLAELPDAVGVGTDVSAAALACAESNARRLGVAARFQAVQTSILDEVNSPFDIVVSNPPYIPSADIAALPLDVKLHDPLLALDGGTDGLTIYREICRQINNLECDPSVVLEVGAGQAQDVAGIFRNSNASNGIWQASFRADLGGHIRCVTMERQSWRQSAKTVGSSPDTI